MRVGMLAYAFYESDTRIQQYATALVERGDSVDVIALRKEGAPSFEVIQGVNVYRIQRRKINEHGPLDYLVRIVRFLVVSAVVLAKKHLSKSYNVIHVHNVPDFLVFGAIVPKFGGARIILDIHDILPEFYAGKFGIGTGSLIFKLLVVVEKLSILFSNHVIIANHLWQERLISRSVRRNKCTAIRNFPNSRIFFPRPRQSTNGKFLIIYPGSLNWYQGVDVAIKAFAKVVNDMPQSQFHIYGEGAAKPALIALANDLGLSETVKFHGLLPTNEIANVMAQADLGVEPKRATSRFSNEAASTKILEFMAVGVPVVVSDTTIHKYYYDDSVVVFFESDNESDLAERMLLLNRHRDLREELVSNAATHAKCNSWDNKKDEYLHLVDSLCTASSKDPAGLEGTCPALATDNDAASGSPPRSPKSSALRD
jgi:glycosyltransferase involved in cell wall biosynthesis